MHQKIVRIFYRTNNDLVYWWWWFFNEVEWKAASHAHFFKINIIVFIIYFDFASSQLLFKFFKFQKRKDRNESIKFEKRTYSIKTKMNGKIKKIIKKNKKGGKDSRYHKNLNKYSSSGSRPTEELFWFWNLKLPPP